MNDKKPVVTDPWQMLRKCQRVINSIPNTRLNGFEEKGYYSYAFASELDKFLEENSEKEKEQQEVIKNAVSIFNTLHEDAKMALDGEWDCTTQEGIETGFTAQITLIDQIVPQLKTLIK